MGVHAVLLVRSPPTPLMVKSSSFPTAQLLLLPQIFIIGLMLMSSCAITSLADGVSSNNDSNALLKFRDSLLSSAEAKNVAQMRQVFSSWNSNSNSTTPCSGNYANWVGALCSDGNVWGLQLENMSLSGEIDVNSLLQLPNLRTLSFMNNSLDGPLPDFKKLDSLRSLYLSSNQFSGQIPNDAFADMPNLKKLYLANNQFSGTIPTSLGQLPKLIDLSLQGNRFVGHIPNLNRNNNLKLFNVSNNQLEGPIPASLAQLSPTLFSGNKGLCGKPLNTICKYPAIDDSTPPDALDGSSDASNRHGEYSMLKAILIVACIGVALGVIILVAIIICNRRRNQTPRLGNAGSSQYNNKSNNIYNGCMAVASSRHLNTMKKKSENGEEYNEHQSASAAVDHTNTTSRSAITATSTAVGGGQKAMSISQNQQQGKLSFIREDRHKFDLQDLLRASAEVLGSGNFGSSYKAVLMDGNSVVVKRFKQMNSVDRQEFNEHMMRLGRLVHPNLLPLVAYYYRKEEKLLVSDYVPNGSLASHLHGNRRVDQPALDWPTRLKIVKGVARGMFYLYKELPSLIVPHGHLKSSNVLVDESFNPVLMDYTLVPVMNQEHARRIMVVYRSPEYIQHGRLSKKTDVWSLGILILELLTGKFPPPNYQIPTAKGSLPAGGAGDLVSWVDSIVKEAEALQVFDKELLVVGNGNDLGNCEGEMLKLFQIGMACCEEDVSKRLDLEEAVNKIQELKEKDRTDNIIVNNNHHNYDLSLL